MEKVREEIAQDNMEEETDDGYNVIMYNDDITPYEYVMLLLLEIFGYTIEQAAEKTSEIHHGTRGVVATLSMDEAYEKVSEVEKMNEQYGFVLQVTVERA